MRFAKWVFAATLVALSPVCPSAWADADPDADRDGQVIKNARENRSVARVLLAYVPNRIFDVLDLVRARARVGPGVAVRARATEGIDVGLGSYASIFVGLPGPRQDVAPPIPIGLETYTGIELGPGDAEVSGGVSPGYSVTEFGASVHLVGVGVDIGVDPFEAIDLLAGFVLLDLRGDDF